MSEKETVLVIDNDVLAEVIIGDTFKEVYFRSRSFVAAVADYCQNAIMVLGREDEETAEIMNRLMKQYIGSDQDETGGKMGILAGSGLTISCNADGVRSKMVELMGKFCGKNPEEKTAWIAEVLTGQRLSSDSFPPMETAPAI